MTIVAMGGTTYGGDGGDDGDSKSNVYWQLELLNKAKYSD